MLFYFFLLIERAITTFRPPAVVNPYPWPGWSALPGCLKAVQHFAWRSCVQQGNCWALAGVVLHLLAGERAEG